MSIVLWIGLILYLVIAVTFSLMMISYWQEEKEQWSGNPLADKVGMLVGSAVWPICVIWGLIKMKKEGN